jgi:hypothetical protein
MSKGEQPRAPKAVPSKVICDALDPPVGGTFLLEISVMPLSQKPVQKWFLPPKRG